MSQYEECTTGKKLHNKKENLKMNLSVTTDYVKDTGDPSPYLRRIADAGFSHVHWCHHWGTDFMYSVSEIEQIGRWLNEYGLKLLDLHASAGCEKNWGSQREYERLAGLELVRNRITMASQLGSHVIILHAPAKSTPELFRRSLDELRHFAQERHVRIALENGNLNKIGGAIADYDPDYVGLCYDSGHGNEPDTKGALDWLDRIKSRLISVHLHDNDGVSDQHKPLFSGTIDWTRLAQIIAGSAYTGCVSMEVEMANSGMEDETAFLNHVFATGAQFSRMIDDERKAIGESAH